MTRCTTTILSSVVMCLAMVSVQGFCPAVKSSNVQSSSVSQTSLFLKSQRPRRAFLSQVGAAVLLVAAPSSSWAVMDVQQKVFQPGQQLSIEEAKARFVLARKDVHYLLDHYAEICEGGGDNVRRYLGTVGISSGMYGIRKVVKELREESDDIVEYTEAMDEFEAYLNQAEGAAYQSLFIEHSSAKGTPEQFLATAKQDVTQMLKYMDVLAVQLGV
jgi:hypothetical protein